MNVDQRQTELFPDPAGDFVPTPAHVKSRLLAWADDLNAAGPTGGMRAGKAALGVAAAAFAGVTLARVLFPRRKSTGSPGDPGTSFGTRLIRLMVLVRTGSWLVPIVAQTVRQLTKPATPK